MKRTIYQITLTLEGPILTKSSSPSDFGVDAAFTRLSIAPDRGKCYIPATHIKGKLRESLGMSGFLAKDLDRIFGEPGVDGIFDTVKRGAWRFTPFIAQKAGQNKLHTRIKVNDDTGSVEHGALLVEEMPFAFGESVDFIGQISILGEEREMEKILHRAFRLLTHIGSNRGIGYGKFLDVKVENVPANHEPLTIPEGDILLPLTISPQGFLCITKHKIGGNLMESDDIIPGNMLAGAIMETAAKLQLADTLKKCFNSITFRHAHPCDVAAQRPEALPLSLVKHKDEMYDCATVNNPTAHAGVAPEFAADWKNSTYAKAEEKYPRAHPFRELLVRTAIDSEKGTADRGSGDRDGKLFAWEVVHPFDSENQHIVWKTFLHLPASLTVGQRSALAKTLAHLSFLSKSKVDATVALGEPVTIQKPSCETGKIITLCLQSPALLADPWRQHQKCGAIPAAQMKEFYMEVFAKILPGLTLEQFYARQQMAGGEYLWHQFQKKKNDYYPWILTAAGSVFTFKVDDAKQAQSSLEQALLTGLKLPEHHKDDTWQTNPYIPANGFGEIRLHQPQFPAYPPLP